MILLGVWLFISFIACGIAFVEYAGLPGWGSGHGKILHPNPIITLIHIIGIVQFVIPYCIIFSPFILAAWIMAPSKEEQERIWKEYDDKRKANEKAAREKKEAELRAWHATKQYQHFQQCIAESKEHEED
jgi:phosphotransferase system  glucose/maltose/N-acetylglucosamine-specific IIC component